MDQQQLHSFEGRCTQEEPPACQTMCPLHMDARSIARLIAEGKINDARKNIDRIMPLSGLLGYLCEGPCMEHCRRAEVDTPVNMPLLERTCVRLTRSVKPMLLPGNSKNFSVAGAGLSGLVLAFEMAKKGYGVTVYHSGPIGGRMCRLDAATLPESVLEQTLEMLTAMRVTFIPVEGFTPQWTQSLLDAGTLYVSLDDPVIRPEDFDIAVNNGEPVLDPVTLGAGHPSLFAGGYAKDGKPAFILEAADGRRVAGSIDRLLKGVSPSSARDKEGVYATTLYTDLSQVVTIEAIVPADPAVPTQEEAQAEAARCIQCECLECVKRCSYLAHYKGYPKRYAREMYNNLAVVHGQRRANTQINSCAECGLCAVICPFDADMGDFCAAAKHDMVQSNRMPPRPHEFALQDMEFSNAPDVAFFRHQPGITQSRWAFFPGCQLPASMPEQTESAYAHLCANLEGGVGLFFSCCGAPARWTGRPKLTGETAGALRERWEQAGKPELILACASCVQFFSKELPDIPAVPLWDILAGLPLPPHALAAPQTLAIHDPCVTRHNAATRYNVRALAEKLGQPVEELTMGGELTRCCGYGGLASYADPEVGNLYALSRADDTANPLLSYCIMCRDRLRSVGSPSLHLLDLLFPATTETLQSSGDYFEQAAARPAPGISSRQESRLDFRRSILKKLWQEAPDRNPRMDNLIINISDEVDQKMEERRILRSDVKQVLLHAKDNGALFYNPDTGCSLASLRPRQVSFWVEYKEEADGSFTIFDAYCHRMVVPGVPGEGASSPCTLEGYAAKGGRM